MTHGNGCAPAGVCPECEIPQLARNHYFTGKLLLARDLTDEQCFHVGKDRRHNQRLHGWGTVCGLRVLEHGTPACRSQYVLIEPGTAIDCCGREILVPRLEQFDFRRAAEEAWRRSGCEGELGDAAHRLQICVRYRECPAEDVPVLFDECANGEECRPNRILEGYAFDVLLDADLRRPEPVGPRLDRGHTINLAGAHRIASDAAGGRLYVATAEDPAHLYVLDTASHALVTSHALPARLSDLALSPDGSRAYVAVATDAPVQVLDTAKLGKPDALVRELKTTSDSPELRLAVSEADGRLFVLDAAAEELITWDGSIAAPGPPPPAGHVTVGPGASGLSLSPHGRWALVSDRDAGALVVVDAETLASSGPLALPSGSAPASVAVAETTAGMRLFVADAEDRSVRVLAFRPGESEPLEPLGEPQQLPHPAIELLASPAGRWLYALLRDDEDHGLLQVVDAHLLQTGGPARAGDALPIDDGPADALLAASGRRLYVATHGLAAPAGGVAIVDVLEERCEEIFNRALEACPGCEDGGECVVLATVEGYRADEPLIARRIDNLRGRRLLVSTDLITQVLRCLLRHPPGQGERGEPGPPGPPGPGIARVEAEGLPCVDGVIAEATASLGTDRILRLGIPMGCRGPQGDPGEGGVTTGVINLIPCGDEPKVTVTDGVIELWIPTMCDPTLRRITGVSWDRDGGRRLMSQIQEGLLIAFSDDVRSADLDSESLVLMVERDWFPFASDWPELELNIEPGMFAKTGDVNSAFTPTPAKPEVNGVRFRATFNGWTGTQQEFHHLFDNRRYRVRLDGDKIRDARPPDEGPQRALDADHIAPGLPSRATGDGIQGGTFLSWFEVGTP
jgi:DNA-binding beta-propeller fold protein YncE